MSFAGLMTNTCTVRRMTVTQDAFGGEVQTWAVASTGNACRLMAKSASERAMSGSTGVAVTHKLFLSAGVDVTEADVIEIDSTEYEVKFVNNVHGHHLELDLWERRPNRG